MTLIFGNDFLDMTMTAKEISGIISDLKSSAQQRKIQQKEKATVFVFLFLTYFTLYDRF